MENETEIFKDLLIVGALCYPLFLKFLAKYRKNKKLTDQILKTNSPSSILQIDELMTPLHEKLYSQQSQADPDTEANKPEYNLKNIKLGKQMPEFLRLAKKTKQIDYSVHGDFIRLEIPLKGRLVSKEAVESIDTSSQVSTSGKLR